jgi:hypothetical protein
MRRVMSTSGALGVTMPPTACRLGFHRWSLGSDDLGERCFACPRCGRVDADNDSHIAAYAMAYGFGGRQPLPHWWRTPTTGA